MNPAHMFLFTVSLAAAFWLGYWAAKDDGFNFLPSGPAIGFNIGLIIAFLASLGMMVSHFLSL